MENERKQLERALLEAQKLEALGTLSASVAHDFNNVLLAIGGAASLAGDRANGDAGLRSLVSEIEAGVGRGTRLTRQLLSFSHRDDGNDEVLALNEVVDDITPMLARLLGDDVTVECRLGSDAGFLRGDRTKIEQVLMNLAVNARDAMDGSGTVTITTSGGRSRRPISTGSG